MPFSHLILCRPLLLLPPIPPSIKVFSNESTLRMRWPKSWSFSFNIIPSKVGHNYGPMKRRQNCRWFTYCDVFNQWLVVSRTRHSSLLQSSWTASLAGPFLFSCVVHLAQLSCLSLSYVPTSEQWNVLEFSPSITTFHTKKFLVASSCPLVLNPVFTLRTLRFMNPHWLLLEMSLVV